MAEKFDIKLILNELSPMIGGQENVEDFEKVIGSLIGLPEAQFELLAPVIQENIHKEFNDPMKRIAITQTINTLGVKAEDLDEMFEAYKKELIDSNKHKELSETKREFLLDMVATLINSIRTTEGIAKRFIKIPIELCRENAKMPTYAHIDDSGMDVYSTDEYDIMPGETITIPLGIKVQLPPGYELQGRPKSGKSAHSKLRIANTPGTIDAGYRGEICVICDNIEPRIKDISVDKDGKISIEYGSPIHIDIGEKLCQLVLAEVPKADLYQISEILSDTDRAAEGFGSTGKY